MRTLCFPLVLVGVLLSQGASADLKIVTTTSDLASIAASVGGKNVSVSSLITGARDAHRLEAKPSFMSRTAGADGNPNSTTMAWKNRM